AVDRDDDLLAALSLDLDHNRAVAPRGCSPAAASHVIAAHVVAQTRERSRGAGRLCASHADHRAQSPPQRQLDALDRNDVRKYRNLALLRQPDLAPPPSLIAPDLQVDRTELIRAAARRVRAVRHLEHAAGVELAGDLTRLGPENGRGM